jgi:hypothetical protein
MLSDSSHGNFARHPNTLAALISGIVDGKSTQQPYIAAKVPDGTKSERRVTRLLDGSTTSASWRQDISCRSQKLLASNLATAEAACHYYQKRFRIKTFFSDQQRRGFHIHKSYISAPQRLSVINSSVLIDLCPC